MNRQKKKGKVIIATMIIASSLLFTGCVPKPYNLQSVSEYASNNREALETISIEAKNVLNDNEAIVYEDGVFTLSSYSEDRYQPISQKGNKYDKLTSFLENSDDIYSIERNIDTVIFHLSSGDTIIITDLELDTIDMSQIDSSLDLTWEKSVENKQLTFTSDHRKDKESYYKGMYYRVDMEYLGKGLYVYHLTTDYPWYSKLIG